MLVGEIVTCIETISGDFYVIKGDRIDFIMMARGKKQDLKVSDGVVVAYHNINHYYTKPASALDVALNNQPVPIQRQARMLEKKQDKPIKHIKFANKIVQSLLSDNFNDENIGEQSLPQGGKKIGNKADNGVNNGDGGFVGGLATMRQGILTDDDAMGDDEA